MIQSSNVIKIKRPKIKGSKRSISGNLKTFFKWILANSIDINESHIQGEPIENSRFEIKCSCAVLSECFRRHYFILISLLWRHWPTSSSVLSKKKFLIAEPTISNGSTAIPYPAIPKAVIPDPNSQALLLYARILCHNCITPLLKLLFLWRYVRVSIFMIA